MGQPFGVRSGGRFDIDVRRGSLAGHQRGGHGSLAFWRRQVQTIDILLQEPL
jgi:hypothetical protein